MPEDFAKHTLTAEYNNLDSVKKLFEEFPNDIACVIIEPVAGNMNCIPPKEDFLQGIMKSVTNMVHFSLLMKS